jgi:hypothetical protein
MRILPAELGLGHSWRSFLGSVGLQPLGWGLERGTIESRRAGVTWKEDHPRFPGGNTAQTFGDTVFLLDKSQMWDDPLTAHEYVHVLQGEVGGVGFFLDYQIEVDRHGYGASNRYEALACLWGGYIDAFGNARLTETYGDNQPWCVFRPIPSTWEYCPEP